MANKKRWLELTEESWQNLFGVIRQLDYVRYPGNFWASIQSLESQFEKDMDEEYYRKEIYGLLVILHEEDKEFMISKEYVREKLNMILNGGIGFHPNVKEIIDNRKTSIRGVFK